MRSSIGSLLGHHCYANELYCLPSVLIGQEDLLFGNRKYLRTRLGCGRKLSEEVGSMLMRDDVMK